MKTVHNPHDKIFRSAMEYPKVAREFLERHLAEDIKKHLDFSSITMCPNSFIDEELKLLQSDVLLKARIFDKDAYVYTLIEHQSKLDKFIPLRLMQYMIKIWNFHIKSKGPKEQLPLPVIVPLVFYTGKGYCPERGLWDLCGEQSQIMQQILAKAFPVVNVSGIPESVMLSNMWSGTLEFIMRPKFKTDISLDIIRIASNLNKILLERNQTFVIELLTYIIDIDNQHYTFEEIINIIHQQIPETVENKIMTLGERLRSEGYEKGRFEGWREGRDEGRDEGRNEGRSEGSDEAKMNIAKKMLAAHIDTLLVSKCTGLSQQEINNIQIQLIK